MIALHDLVRLFQLEREQPLRNLRIHLPLISNSGGLTFSYANLATPSSIPMNVVSAADWQ